MKRALVLMILFFLTAPVAQGASMRLTAVIKGTRNPTAQEVGKSIVIVEVSGAQGLFDQVEAVMDETLQPNQKNAVAKQTALAAAKADFPVIWANATVNDVDLWGAAS